MLLVAVLSSALAATPTHATMESANWQQLTTKSHSVAGEIGVWHAMVAGSDCFRGTAVAKDATPNELLEVVSDIVGAKEWSHAGVTEAQVLATSGNHIEYYQYLDVPGWTMASDRFWFCEADLVRGDTKATFKWDRLVDGGDHKSTWDSVKANHSNAVEPPLNVGGWFFEKKSDGTHISYEICTHPGGTIPVAIQNAATRRTLPDTVGDVIKEAGRRSGR